MHNIVGLSLSEFNGNAAFVEEEACCIHIQIVLDTGFSPFVVESNYNSVMHILNHPLISEINETFSFAEKKKKEKEKTILFQNWLLKA